MHSALQWTKEDPYPIEDAQPESPFEILSKDYRVEKKAPTNEFPNKRSDIPIGHVQAQGSQVLPAVSVYDGKKASKRKAADETLEIKSNPTKRAKTSNVTPVCTL